MTRPHALPAVDLRRVLTVVAALALALPLFAPTVDAAPPQPAKTAVATGYGGAAATVDAWATEAAMDILRRGGNAIDATVAAAAVLGVTQPYSGGIGGGGFMVIRTADGQLTTIDSREKAPASASPTMFLQPDGTPIPFAERVTSGLGVGVPGTVAGWELALERYGTMDFRRTLQPAVVIANRGFRVDETFRSQTESNRARFADFTSTRALYLNPDGTAPAIGTKLRNPDLAKTYQAIQQGGAAAFYAGPVAADIAATVQHPPTVENPTRTVRPGGMTTADLAAYDALEREPTRITYRGLEVVGMGPPSSGGSTVGEALNILEGWNLGALDRTQALHLYLEASRVAFADRNVYVGDPDFVDVPLDCLLSQAFADQRRTLIDPDAARPTPYPAGDCGPVPTGASAPGGSTTHLTVSDAAGNVVAYTFTIEQTGGSGMVVPGRGFLLNNELTDFNAEPGTANSAAPGKRPRSSMAPTIVLEGGEPRFALGTPGGATIITTVLQMLVNRIDFGMDMPTALAAPRAAHLNGAAGSAEAAFLSAYPDLTRSVAQGGYGHVLNSTAEIGAATAIEFLPDGRVQAVAEPVRRGGGHAMVERDRQRGGPPAQTGRPAHAGPKRP